MNGRFSEEQIIGILKRHEAGQKLAELAREHGISEATIYTWKGKYGGMEVSEAQRLKGSVANSMARRSRLRLVFAVASGGDTECNVDESDLFCNVTLS